MNNAEFLTSLSPEQSAAFVALRDELLAANQVAMGEITKAKADEIAALDASVKNAADALKTAQDEKAAVQAQLDARVKLQAELITRAATAHAAGDMDGIGAVITDATKDDVQRAKDALDAEIAAKQAERAKLG